MARVICKSFIPGKPGWICPSCIDALIGGDIAVKGMTLDDIVSVVSKTMVEEWSVTSDEPVFCTLCSDLVRVELTPAAERAVLDQLDNATRPAIKAVPDKALRVLMKTYAEHKGIDYESKMDAVKVRAEAESKARAR